MESVLKLQPHQEIVLEGYLYKKSQTPLLEGNNSRIALNSSSWKWKKRYFVLLRTRNNDSVRGIQPEAVLLYYLKKPRKVKAKVKNSDSVRSRRSSSEIPELTSVVKPLHGFMKNARGKVTKAILKGQKLVTKKGKIQLIAGNQVFLNADESLSLRLNYQEHRFRAEKSDKSSVVLGQWLQALSQSLIMLSVALRELDAKKNQPTTFYSPLARENGKDNKGQIPLPRDLEEVLGNKILRDELFDFLRLAQATENLLFYEEAARFRTEAEALYRRAGQRNREFHIKKQATYIFDQFINVKSKQIVNISSSCRSKIIEAFAESERLNRDGIEIKKQNGILSPELFESAQNEVFLLMEANFFHLFYKDLSKRTGCFSNLVFRYDIPGYDAVFSRHFGYVKTESDRMKTRFENRLKDLKLQISQLNNITDLSQAIAVKDFETSSELLRSLYEINQKKKQHLLVIKGVLQKQLKALMDFSVSDNFSLAKINDSDEDILSSFKKIITQKQELEDKKSKCDTAYADFKKGTKSIEELAKIFSFEDMSEECLEEKKSLMNSKFHKAMIKLAKVKDTLKNKLTKSLDEAEKIDLRRITAQQLCCRKLLEAEEEFITNFQQNLNLFTLDIVSIDPEYDCRAFAGLVVLSNEVSY